MPRPLPRPPIKPVVDFVKTVLPALCPNPRVSVSLPPKIDFTCR